MDLQARRGSGGELQIVATPSHPDGVFVAGNNYYGVRAVREVELSNIPIQDKERVEAGDPTVYDRIVAIDHERPGVVHAAGSTAMSATISVPGTRQQISMPIREVQEFAPLDTALVQVGAPTE